MIVLQIYGNIGEQLFKYAAAKNFATIYKTNLLLDISWYLKNKKNKLEPNKISINAFKTEFGMAGSVIINNFMKPKQKFYLNRFPEVAKYKVITENKKEFCSELYSTNPPYYMIGEFKSEKYFEESIETIREEIVIDINLQKKIKSIITRIENTNSIAVLVQKKTINKNNLINDLQIDWDYLKQAVIYFQKHVTNPHFVILTDIEQENFDNLEIHFSKEIIQLYQNELEWRNLLIMSKCKYLISDNSATSWWASWLNITPNRTVILPKYFIYDYPEITHNKLGIIQNWIKL